MRENKQKSLMRIIKRNRFVFITFVVIIAIIAITSLIHEWLHMNSYMKNRETFRVINDVIAGRREFNSILPYMKEYGFDYRSYEELLDVYKNDESIKNEILTEICKFAEFVRKSEENDFKESYKILTFSMIFIVFGLSIGMLFSHRNYKLVKCYIKDSKERFNELADNIYVAKLNEANVVRYSEDEDIQRAVYKINLVHDILESLKHVPMTASIEDFISETGSALCRYFDSERFSVALIDHEESKIVAETAYFTDKRIQIKLGPGFSQKFSETSLGKMITERTNWRIINDFEEFYSYTKSKSMKLLLEEGFKSNLTVLASINTVPFGFFFLTSSRPNNFTEDDAKLFFSVSDILSHRLYYTLNLQKALSEFAHSLTDLVEFKDNETGNHIKRVSLYTKLIASNMNLPPKLIRILYDFAPLHDIGKVGIPDSILLKPGRLDSDEWKIMQTHVGIGMHIIDRLAENTNGIIDAETINSMRNIVQDHHERWDGKGYPNGKRGEEISIEGRILAIADVFDALTTRRPYKESVPFDVAVDMIVKEKGRHFDPAVVNAFTNCLEEIRSVYEMLKD